MKNAKPTVTLVYREKRKSAYSIERLFKSLEPHLKTRYELISIVLPWPPNRILNVLRNVLYVHQHARGIVHVTGDAQYIIAFLPFRKTILTIHDCGHLACLKGLKKWIYRWFWFKIPCKLATAITTISESTREVLERKMHPNRHKLRVIENCLPEGLIRKEKPFNSELPKVLQIGTGHHKNLDSLIKAVVGIPCELKIVGCISDEDQESLKDKKIQYTNEYAVSGKRLKEIYAECDILYFASRYEGFGLPILEAQQVGIAVITSNCYSMPHVVGKGGIVCDPDSIEEIQCAINKLISDADYREKLIYAGFENIKRFSPPGVAKNYMSLYNGI